MILKEMIKVIRLVNEFNPYLLVKLYVVDPYLNDDCEVFI